MGAVLLKERICDADDNEEAAAGDIDVVRQRGEGRSSRTERKSALLILKGFRRGEGAFAVLW